MRHQDSQNFDQISITVCIERIVNLTKKMNTFWRNAKGWAPIEAAQLLSKSRLDWQVDLAQCLNIWTLPDKDRYGEGFLIMAWANLGSLLEGIMKLFLSVYYKDYKNDINAIRSKGILRDPDTLQLEPLRHFFKKRIWKKEDPWDKWIELVQRRRNAIHAFRDHDIGTFEEWEHSTKMFLAFLRYINSRLPYPDDGYTLYP